MKKTKRAILWGSNDLLSRAMELFLTAGETWEVIRIPVEQGHTYLLGQAKLIHPNVIILYTKNCFENPSLPMELIQYQPNLQVVTVSLEENQMQVYSKQSIQIRAAADLMSIIEDRYFSEHADEQEVKQQETNVSPGKADRSGISQKNTGENNEN
jgi:hypothetical protein